MNNLKNENDQTFEEGLKEILSCKENKITQKSSSGSLPEKEMIFSNIKAENKASSKNYLFLRIIAALTALGLIALFGLQIAYK
ncbi:MAG TPA: hypothetical protein VKY57_16920 [Chitinispirillaceae bacterium]|nr:hypothetical protein [Chitinispirillaceae bacterium]